MAGIDILHVPYRGSSPAMTDLLAGRVSSYMVTYSVFDAYDREGKLKVVAAATPNRLPNRPDLPTISETVPGYSIDVWFGFARDERRPRSWSRVIHDDVVKVVHEEALHREDDRPQATSRADLTRQQFEQQIQSDFKKWGELVRSNVHLTRGGSAGRRNHSLRN